MSQELKTPLSQAKDDFVTQWGAIGSAWGINRTMAQIHALLMVTARPLSTDEVMDELKISRGNAHSNLRELIGWGLIRSVIRKGERKEYFEAEKDVWKMFCIIVRERKRREIDPALEVLTRCRQATKGLKGEEAEVFQKQIAALSDFVAVANRVMDKVANGSESQLMPLALKMIK
ncbi:MAG: transcriptional regulator [Blastochloris sp.]|nr:transcriptional regulator [Blastochloris sp.]